MKLLYLFPLLFLQSCALLEAIEENPLGMRVIVSQSVSRYIESGDITKRKNRVIGATARYEAIVDANLNAPLKTVVELIRQDINNKDLSISDKLLFIDLLFIVEKKLEDNQSDDETRIPEDTIISIKGLLLTAKNTALMFAQ